MKPFNLEEAKAGKPVCNRMGNDVRIICDNKKDSTGYSIIALHLTCENDNELIISHTRDGKLTNSGTSPYDLFMKSEKKEGWVNIYKDSNGTYKNSILIHSSKEDAIKERYLIDNYIDTVKIKWEE